MQDTAGDAAGQGVGTLNEVERLPWGRPLLGQCRASVTRVKGAPLRYASATPMALRGASLPAHPRLAATELDLGLS